MIKKVEPVWKEKYKNQWAPTCTCIYMYTQENLTGLGLEPLTLRVRLAVQHPDQSALPRGLTVSSKPSLSVVQGFSCQNWFGFIGLHVCTCQLLSVLIGIVHVHG